MVSEISDLRYIDVKYRKFLRKIEQGYVNNFNMLVVSYFLEIDGDFFVSDFY